MCQSAKREAGMFVIGGVVLLYAFAYLLIGLRQALDGKGQVVLGFVALLVLRLAWVAYKRWRILGGLVARVPARERSTPRVEVGIVTLKSFLGSYAVLLAVFWLLRGLPFEFVAIAATILCAVAGALLCVSAARSWRRIGFALDEQASQAE